MNKYNSIKRSIDKLLDISLVHHMCIITIIKKKFQSAKVTKLYMVKLPLQVNCEDVPKVVVM